MKMSLVVDELRSDLVSVAELGDETVAEAAERIATLLGRSLPARILDLLSEVAAELSSELQDGRVEIRVAGDDVHLAYVVDEHVQAVDSDGDLSARITLRLTESLKARVEEGAAGEGISVNSYITRTLERATSTNRSRTRAGGNRLHGYGTT
jgi:predicted HicB family RNase H-like nuclease